MHFHRAVLFAVVGALLVPLFGRIALSGTGHEHEHIRYLVPLFVGAVAGAAVGLSLEKMRLRDAELRRVNLELQDALERTEAAAVALAEGEERLQRLQEANPAGVVVIDQEDCSIVDVNAAAARMVGRTREELLGRTCHRFICPQEVGACPVPAGLRGVAQAERTLLGRDGLEIPILKSVTPITLGGRPHLLEAFLDLRDLKAAESERHDLHERLATLERVEALGVLAGGVAHDLNNVLGPLVALPDVVEEGLASLALGDTTDLDHLREDLATIKDSARRASRTVEDLSTLSRRARMQREVLDLREVVSTWVEKEGRRLVGATRLDLCLAEGPLPVHASRPHLVRVLANLVGNAVDAAGRDGRVEVWTRRQGGGAVVEVRDDGPGIPPEDLERIFEPFFGRKHQTAHAGSGLGLTIVRQVVQDHRGTIEVRSMPGQGAVFTVTVPLTEDAPQVRVPEERTDGHGERILVVDDEAHQRRVARRVLQRLGYRVEVVSSGHEALTRFAEAEMGGEPFDLVLLDMIMEGMDGAEVLRCIRRLCPKQPVLMVSGFAPAEAGAIVSELGVEWLQKPYGIDQVASAVRGVLAG